jgi:hypothetical protein
MASTIGFDTVQKYLDGFAGLGTIGNSPHKAFWKTKSVGGVHTPITYDDFVSGAVPNVKYRGAPIPIIWKEAPLLSPFFLILAEPNGFAGIDQMIPFGGAHLTDAGISITLSDGTTVTGAQVIADLQTWLSNGFPKDPTPIP